MPLSPYVEKPLNSKVIKSFVPELRSRYVFFEFRDTTFYVIYVYLYGHSMYVSHIAISWLWYIIRKSQHLFGQSITIKNYSIQGQGCLNWCLRLSCRGSENSVTGRGTWLTGDVTAWP